MNWLDSIDIGLTVQILVFALSSISFAALISWLSSGFSPAKKRLHKMLENEHHPGETYQEEGFTVKWTKPLADLVLPEENWRRSHIKSRLVLAGFRNPNSVYIYIVSKLLLTLFLTLIVVLIFIIIQLMDLDKKQMLYLLTTSAVFGFFIPDLYLSHRKDQRITAITEEFPDALDLLVVCVEAGLSLDAAISKVSRELLKSHSPLGDELGLVTLELRAGKGRNESLKALADRTGIDDIRSLTSILIQAENFGTSIAAALREQANEMRSIRIQRAKEKAAKLPVKLAFPILFFIFPSLFLVILGPAVIRILERLINAG